MMQLPEKTFKSGQSVGMVPKIMYNCLHLEKSESLKQMSKALSLGHAWVSLPLHYKSLEHQCLSLVLMDSWYGGYAI